MFNAIKRKAKKWIFIFFLCLIGVVIIDYWLYFGATSNDQEIYMDTTKMLYGGEADEDGISPGMINGGSGGGTAVGVSVDGFVLPLSAGTYRISSGFGPRNTGIAGASKYHKGIDLARASGVSSIYGDPVYAALDGTVVKAGKGSGYGNVIYIQHADGTSTRYGHLSSIDVKPGDTVSAGQQIGAVGNTGVSSGPHLHFEYLINGTQVDPEKYFKF